MGQGSITRKASDLRPLLLDRFRNAAAAYSLRPLTLSGQDNPVVKVRRSVDNTEQDFNPAQINDGTLEQFVNAGDVAPADYGTGAAAAYSLRHVSDGYTGDVVRVRRSVDNTEQDFNPTEIEDGTLLAWVGTSGTDNGFVTTWYDQSGNSNDATQATAASQPKIVSGGSLVTENGKPGIDFDGVDDLLSAGDILSGLATLNVFTVSKIDSSNGFDDIYNKGIGAVGEREYGLLIDSGMVTIDEDLDTNSTASSTTPANQFLAYSGYDASNVFVGIDGAALSTNTALTVTVRDQTSNLVFMGSDVRAGSDRSNGNIQEAIFYDSDQSSNRELIETNVNHYYSIYSQTNDGFVTTWYDQSGNGNHATQSTAASQPKIVSAGSLVVENGKAALDFYSTSVTISAPNMTNSTNCDVFLVYKISGNSVFASNGGITPPYFLIVQDGQGSSVFTFYGTPEVRVNDALISPINRNILHDTIIDSQKLITVSAADFSSQTIFEINGFGGSLGNTGKVQETVIYPTDRSSTRQQIESNINTHYGIY